MRGGKVFFTLRAEETMKEVVVALEFADSGELLGAKWSIAENGIITGSKKGFRSV